MTRSTPLGLLTLGLLAACGCSSHAARLKANAETLRVSIGLHPLKPGQADPGGGLRSVLLHASDSLLVEPAAVWADGTPVSAVEKLDPAELIAVVDELGRLGVWRDADLYHSEARNPTRHGPPAGESRTAYRRPRDRPVVEVIASYTDRDYHSYVISSVPWGPRTTELLNAIRPHISASLADELAATAKRFP